MLGGALLGLGLGSLMSQGDRNQANQNAQNQDGVNQNGQGQASGTSADGTTVSGTGETQANASQQAAPAPGNRFGSLLLWAALALGAFFLFKRARARRRGY
ncbi:MAG: hypothetical protein JWP36_538 [Paucimonas sp.]|nr:hypothetical protein [Paucimonas sp.]